MRHVKVGDTVIAAGCASSVIDVRVNHRRPNITPPTPEVAAWRVGATVWWLRGRTKVPGVVVGHGGCKVRVQVTPRDGPVRDVWLLPDNILPRVTR